MRMDNPLFFFTPNISRGSINPLEDIVYPEDDLYDHLMCSSSYDHHNLVEFMRFEGCLIDADELHAVRGEALQPADQQDSAVNGDSYSELHVEDEALPSEGAQKEHGIHDGDSSPSTIARTRRDRSKTLVAERKRRVRTKEKLYELRSLVPNITKVHLVNVIACSIYSFLDN